VAADGDIHLSRLKDLLLSLDTLEKDGAIIDNEVSFDALTLIEKVHWSDVALSTGFCLLDERFYYIAENEIFSRQRIVRSNKIKNAKGLSIKELKQLNIGDYIVHEDKGIGKFAGFQTIELGGSKQDCMKVLFADEDVLYVHLNYLHKVQKYSASEGVIPRLSKLGSTE
jgi:transcription-repair coupling factor (superfamily II helicase)